MHGDDLDREKTIRAMLPLVRRIARRVRSVVPTVDLDDLVGDGSIGLIRAVDNFDPHRGPPLDHYARRLILGAMLNGIRRMDPVPERARRTARDGENLRYQLAAERGALPSTLEIERMRPGFIRASTTTVCGTPLSLDAALPEGESLPSDWGGDPAAVVGNAARSAEFQRLIDVLPERQRRLIREHYFAERSLRDVGARMGISSQRASQLHMAAIRKLKKALYAAPG